MNATGGRRARKKEATRLAISVAAQTLFAERGFDGVTVAEIAAAADVSEVTVFNHFATKEDLFFGGMTAFEERLLAAVGGRRSGQSAVAAFMRAVAAGADDLATRHRVQAAARGAAAISSSRTLLGREREIVEAYADRLADLLRADSGARPEDLEPAVVAAILMAAHRALVRHVRTRLLAGWRGDRLVDDIRAQTRRMQARLERGLASYAVRA